jgi:hypothetical protein
MTINLEPERPLRWGSSIVRALPETFCAVMGTRRTKVAALEVAGIRTAPNMQPADKKRAMAVRGK